MTTHKAEAGQGGLIDADYLALRKRGAKRVILRADQIVTMLDEISRLKTENLFLAHPPADTGEAITLSAETYTALSEERHAFRAALEVIASGRQPAAEIATRALNDLDYTAPPAVACRPDREALHAIAKDAAERVHKNGGCVPQLAYAPILWALQDALSAPPSVAGEPCYECGSTDMADRVCLGCNDVVDKSPQPQADMAVAIKALESIAKNTCCDRCQEAALVAAEALRKLREKS